MSMNGADFFGASAEELEFAGVSLEEKASLDDEFSLAMLGGPTGILLFESVQLAQKNAVHERNIFP